MANFDFKFLHEMINEEIESSRKVLEYKLNEINSQKEVYEFLFDNRYELEEIFDSFKHTTFVVEPNNCNGLLYFWLIAKKGFKVQRFANSVFDTLDPFLENHGFKLDSDNCKIKQNQGDLYYYWIHKNTKFKIKLEVNYATVCDKIQIGTEPVYKYTCKQED